jgi:hypothetical protein
VARPMPVSAPVIRMMGAVIVVVLSNLQSLPVGYGVPPAGVFVSAIWRRLAPFKKTL